jgi:DUF2934 family protein
MFRISTLGFASPVQAGYLLMEVGNAEQATILAKDEPTMSDEKPKKTRRSTGTRATTKRNDVAPPSTTDARVTTEDPAIAIERASEVTTPASDDTEEIRRQAYDLYVARGGIGGDDLSDWLEAERIVRTRRESNGDRSTGRG